MHRCEVLRLDGRLWFSTYCNFRDEWHWVSSMLAGIYECDPDDVEIKEDEDRGDVLTVAGIEVGLLPAPKRRMT